MHLGDFARRRPHQLSGGMRQRVPLARALALTDGAGPDRTVLLMDEPFGALDAMTRDLLHDEVERIWRDRNLTVVFVTHNVREAVAGRPCRAAEQPSRPGRGGVPVAMARPRRIDSPEAASLAAAITDRLREEVVRHGA